MAKPGELVDEPRRRALVLLRALTEEELSEQIIGPFFKRKRWECDDTCTKGEQDHGCDLLLSRASGGDEILRGVQLKRVSLDNPSAANREIANYATKALKYRHQRGRQKILLERFFWITSGEIKPNAWGRIEQGLGLDEGVSGRLDVWDGNLILREIEENGFHDLLGPLEMNDLEEKIQRHESSGRLFSAAFYSARLARLHLEREPQNVPQAADLLRKTIDLITADPQRHRYFHRTLKKFYEMWLWLCEERSDLWLGATSLFAVLKQPQAQEALQTKFPGALPVLLTDFEAITAQLGDFEKTLREERSSLSGYRTCRLLLRTGFPVDLEGNANMLRVGLTEMREAGHPSIDNKCSLCTGTFASCLGLAGAHEVEAAALWFASLEGERFCVLSELHTNIEIQHLARTDIQEHEHALHYAASVLEGLLDANYGPALREKVLAEFFVAEPSDPLGFPTAWTKYRHISKLELCFLICSALIVFLMAGGHLSDEQRLQLRTATAAVYRSILQEEIGSKTPWRFYDARRNLGTLALALYLGNREVVDLMRSIAWIFHQRAQIVQQVGPEKELPMWKSGMELTRDLIEAYLQYWEILLLMEEEGTDIGSFLPEMPCGVT